MSLDEGHIPSSALYLIASDSHPFRPACSPRGKRSTGIVFLSVGVGVLFTYGREQERGGSAAEMGEGRVLGISRG